VTTTVAVDDLARAVQPAQRAFANGALVDALYAIDDARLAAKAVGNPFSSDLTDIVHELNEAGDDVAPHARRLAFQPVVSAAHVEAAHGRRRGAG
jgi:hypothetical protein